MLDLFLQNYGFTNKEAKIYLATLELWQAPASTIARSCKENRLTTYSVLKELMKKWIIQEMIKNKVKVYVANLPSKILDEQKRKYEELEQKMPELMALTNTIAGKPKILYYEWASGMEEAYMDTIQIENCEMRSFTWVASVNKDFRKFLDEKYLPERIKRKVWAKVLLKADEESKKYAGFNKKSLRESLLVDDEIFELVDDIILYWENKVLISMFREDQMSAVIIQSDTLFKTLEWVHKLLWKIYFK